MNATPRAHPDPSEPVTSRGTPNGRKPVEAIVGSAVLAPSVSVEPTVGHSWGHQLVRVESGGDVAIYLGHLVIHPLQIARPGVHEWEHDSAIAAGPRTQYLGELADRGGLLLTTLIGGDGGGRVTRDGDGFRVD